MGCSGSTTIKEVDDAKNKLMCKEDKLKEEQKSFDNCPGDSTTKILNEIHEIKTRDNSYPISTTTLVDNQQSQLDVAEFKSPPGRGSEKEATIKEDVRKKNLPPASIVKLMYPILQHTAGLFTESSGSDTLLAIKGHTIDSLDNMIIDTINYSIKRIKQVYKNQTVANENEEFIDPLFPPNSNSLLGKRQNGKYIDTVLSRRNQLQEAFPLIVDDIIWLSAKEIFYGQEYSIFTNDIDINDVIQGNLGNCYLMSSLAAIAKNPQLICQVFKTFKVPQNGCYQIGMKIEGKWKIVLLDDYFPCHRKTRIPIFAKPHGAELWVMLLEKAWAKVNGGYINIIGGWTSEVLACLTPFPIETIRFKKVSIDQLWNLLRAAYNAGHIISSCSRSHSDVEDKGIISGHAFTVTELRSGEVDDNLIRLIRLRNPWGYREWNGNWSDNSACWTPAAKKAFNFDSTPADDGVFWMSIEDFFCYFCIVDICKVTFPQCVKTLVIPSDKVELPNIFELHCLSQSKFIFSIEKKYYRFHRTMATQSALVINCIIVKKITNEIKYIASKNENEINPMIECELDVGYYLIYVHANYHHSNFDKKRKYLLYVSSNKFFDLFQKGYDTDFHLLKSIIAQHVQSTNTDKDKDDATIIIQKNKFEMTTYGYAAAINNTNKPANFFWEDESQNFQILYPPHNQISIMPGNIEVIIGIRQEFYEQFKFSINFEETEDDFTLPPPLHISPFIDNCKDRLINGKSFDFYIKKIPVNVSNIVENINYIQVAEQHFKEKYPKEMELILCHAKKLEDGEEVIFRDLFPSIHGEYLGEWKVKEELMKHGRGLFSFREGEIYIGQFKNDVMNGVGILFLNQNERVEITYEGGVMHGRGRHITSEGIITEVEYENGVRKDRD